MDRSSDNARLLNVIFINYGLFDSNSGGHVGGFANALRAQGHRVVVVGQGTTTIEMNGAICVQADDIISGSGEQFRHITHQPNTIVHAWTPREQVRIIYEKLSLGRSLPLIVHLEDNETVITSSQVGMEWSTLGKMPLHKLDALIPLHLSHPIRSNEFIRRSWGSTVITESLEAFIPRPIPVCLLEPGVDTNMFKQDLTPSQRYKLRKHFYLEDDEVVIVYPGNMHPGNRHEIFSLYCSVMILRRRGHKIRLIRTGKNFAEPIDVSFRYLCRNNVIDLGYVSPSDLLAVMKIGDVFVQPGAINDFNRFRLPSKLPEFLSMGRPVVLPRTNIGLQLRDWDNAILLDHGHGVEIANAVERILRDPDLAARVGSNGRAFAQANFSWEANASGLASYYWDTLRKMTVA